MIYQILKQNICSRKYLYASLIDYIN